MNREKLNKDIQTIKVSDWSQPIKITIFISFFIVTVLFVWLVVVPFGKEVLGLLREIANNTK